MYTIYEIPGVKVGCTKRSPEVRVKEQGYTQFRVVEEVNDINIASERERYWQEVLGYEKDNSRDYAGTVSASLKSKLPEAEQKRVQRFKETIKQSVRYKETRCLANSPEAIAKKKQTWKSSEKWKSSKIIGSQKRKIPIEQFDRQGNFIREWSSGTDASISLSIARADISSCLTGKLKSAGGYKWKYKCGVINT